MDRISDGSAIVSADFCAYDIHTDFRANFDAYIGANVCAQRVAVDCAELLAVCDTHGHTYINANDSSNNCSANCCANCRANSSARSVLLK